MVISIRKGKSWERDMANLLTKQLGVKFHRVPMSGGFASVNKSEDSRFCGDVFTEDETYKNYVIECKSYKDFGFNDFFKEKSNLYKWIKQSEDESGDKEWLLFIKIKNKGRYVIVEDMETFNYFFRSRFLFNELEIKIEANNKTYYMFEMKC